MYTYVYIMLTLFDEDLQVAPSGLAYQEGFLSVAEEAELMEWIDGLR